MIKKYIEFCKKENLLCVLISLIIFVIFGSHLFSRNMYVDTQLFLLNPMTNYNWLSIGRFGLVALKYIIGLGSFNLYYANGLFMIALIITSMYLAYFIKKYTKNNNILMIILSIFIIFGSPIYTEQFYFVLQSAEIILGILMTLLSVDLIFTYLSKNKIYYLILSIILNIIDFGVYQAFIPMYISLIIGIYILNYSKESSSSKEEFKKFRKISIILIGSFLVSFIIYYIISKFFIASDYLTASISWGKSNIQILKNICSVVYNIVTGQGIFFDLSFLIMAIFLIILQLKNNYKKNNFYKLKNTIVTALFLITPFLLNIYSGSAQVVRSYLNLPFVIAFGYIIIIDFITEKIKNIKIKKIMLVLVYIVILFFSMKQYYVSCKLYYADDIRNDSDILLANNIYKDVSSLVDDVSKYHIFILGLNEINLPDSAYKGVLMGESIFNLYAGMTPYHFWSTKGVQDMWKIQGKKAFKENSLDLSKEVISYVKSKENIPNYPNKDSILIKDDLIIVKISDDYYKYK